MPDYAVKTTFLGVDKVSHLFDQMGRSADRFGERGRNAMRGVGREADHASTALRNAGKHGYNFGAIVKGILAANAIRGGIGYITGGVAHAATSFLQFGDVMTGAVARFGEVDVASKAFGETIERQGLQVRKAMAGTRYGAVEGAKAFNELAKAGYNSGAAIGILPNLTAFATVAQEDLAEATTMSSDILGGFGLRSENVQKQLANHIRLNDMLTKSALLATGDLRDMFETMQVVAPLAKEMNVLPETALAMATALSNAGIKGSEAGTAFKRGMMAFYGTRMAAELKVNKVFAFDKNGDPRKLTDVYKDFGKAVSKLKAEDRFKVFERVFQMYGLSGNVKLTQELAKVDEFEKKIAGAAGTVSSLAKATNSSPFAKLAILGNTALEKSFQLLDNYAGGAGKGFDMLSEKIKAFDVRPTVDALNNMGTAVGGLYRVVGPFLPYLPQATIGFLSWTASVKLFQGAAWLAARPIWNIGAALISGLGPLAAMKTGLVALMVPLASVSATFAAVFSSVSALYSLITQKDNAISMWAQDMGLVPTLSHDEDGHVLGGGWLDKIVNWMDSDPEAPNKEEAKSRARAFLGTLNIAGAPPGSTLTTQSSGPPPINMRLLGAQ